MKQFFNVQIIFLVMVISFALSTNPLLAGDSLTGKWHSWTSNASKIKLYDEANITAKKQKIEKNSIPEQVWLEAISDNGFYKIIFKVNGQDYSGWVRKGQFVLPAAEPDGISVPCSTDNTNMRIAGSRGAGVTINCE